MLGVLYLFLLWWPVLKNGNIHRWYLYKQNI
uniref:Uncharacterized protein n=1 Tax=Arundo donax TaxID=35708 RepID=A0A0A8Y0I8_ARUDO